MIRDMANAQDAKPSDTTECRAALTLGGLRLYVVYSFYVFSHLLSYLVFLVLPAQYSCRVCCEGKEQLPWERDNKSVIQCSVLHTVLCQQGLCLGAANTFGMDH